MNIAENANAEQENQNEDVVEGVEDEDLSSPLIAAAVGDHDDDDDDDEDDDDDDEEEEEEDLTSPLIAAAKAGDLIAVQSLLEQGADKNEITNI